MAFASNLEARGVPIRVSNTEASKTVRRIPAWLYAVVAAALLVPLAWWPLRHFLATEPAPPVRPTVAAPAAVEPAAQTVQGMPPVTDPKNLYSETAAGKLSPAVDGALERV